MAGKMNSGAKGGGSLSGRVGELRAALSAANPAELSARVGAEHRSTGGKDEEILLRLWGRDIAICFPCPTARDARTGRELSLMDQALLLFYLRNSDGAPLTGRWISLGELPDGTFYTTAFQGYTGDLLVREFGNDIEAFTRAARGLGGEPEESGDAAFTFEVLPRVTIAAVYWRGDDEFPPSAKLLFDSSAGHHLPTDVCAIIGATLTGRLIKARRPGGGK